MCRKDGVIEMILNGDTHETLLTSLSSIFGVDEYSIYCFIWTNEKYIRKLIVKDDPKAPDKIYGRFLRKLQRNKTKRQSLKNIESIYFYHVSRCQKASDYEKGLYPVSTFLTSFWENLYEISETTLTKEEWNKITTDYDKWFAGYTDPEREGPYGSCLKEYQIVHETVSPNYVMGGLLIRNFLTEHNIDTTNYLKNTKPFIITFKRDASSLEFWQVENYVIMALYYLCYYHCIKYPTLWRGNSLTKSHISNYGKPIKEEDIVKIEEFIPTPLSFICRKLVPTE